jgi:glycosyltransferase involved in cell wall biosynthesis
MYDYRMVKPTVTIITSAYKSDNYLKTFLECCLEQTYFTNTQYVLNISEATDGEKKVLSIMRKFFDGRLRIIYNRRRIGIYRAWNECIDKSNGELISIWNVDDIRTVSSIETQVELMKDHNFLSASGNFTVISRFGDHTGTKVKLNRHATHDYYSSMLHGPFFMFRREVLHKLQGFDEQLESASDFDFCIRLANLGPVATTDENIGYYLDSGRGMSTSKRIEIAAEREFIYQRYGILNKLDPSFLHLTRKWDMNRIQVLGRKLELENVTHNLEEILKSNSQEANFRLWANRLKKELRRRRLVTFLFYARNPMTFYRGRRKRIESATRFKQ